MERSAGGKRREARAALAGSGISIGAHVIAGLALAFVLRGPAMQARDVGTGVTTTIEVGIAEEASAPHATDSVAPTVATDPRPATRKAALSPRRRAVGPIAEAAPRPAAPGATTTGALTVAPETPPPVEESPAPVLAKAAHTETPAARNEGPPQATPIFVPGDVAQYLREQDYFPSLPSSLREVGGSRHHARLDICVSTEGRVVDVGMREATAPALNTVLQAAVRGWRYHPLIVDGMPKPFCHRMMVSYEVM